MKKKSKSKIEKKQKKNISEDSELINKKVKRSNKEKESSNSKDIDNINNSNEFQSKPKNIKISKNIIQDSAIFSEKNFTFIIFKSIDNIFYIVYGTNRRSIVFYNLLDNKKMATINNFRSYVNYFRHILDEKNKRDLILSQNSGVQIINLNIWNVNSLECIFNFKENLLGNIESCFLNYQHQIYIIISEITSETINCFDLEGNKVKQINNISHFLKYIECYHDLKTNKSFIIICNIDNIILYDYNTDEIYHKFEEQNCSSFSIFNSKESVKLIARSIDSILIWNFHSKELLKKIHIKNISIFCLWSEKYIMASDYINNAIFAINLDDGKKKNIISHQDSVVNIIKIIHPIYGECLLSQDKKGIIKISY